MGAKYHLVTTMHRAGYDQTGRRMVNSVVGRWPVDALPLVIYAEGFEPEPIAGIEVRRLPEWMVEFKRKHGGTPLHNGRGRALQYDYRFDAVRFAHKVAAMTDLGLTLDDGVMIWLDADTFTHADVTEDWLDGLFPPPAYLAWLDRANSHPECGLVMYRCSHPYHHSFMESFARLYTSGDVFRLAETHDSFVLQWLVRTKAASGKIEQPVSLSGDARTWHHPFVVGPLGARMDHAKGPRKIQGRSRRRDLKTPRTEAYWNAGPV